MTVCLWADGNVIVVAIFLLSPSREEFTHRVRRCETRVGDHITCPSVRGITIKRTYAQSFKHNLRNELNLRHKESW